MSGKKILVVDDEPHVVRTLTFVLTKEGYDVSSAVDGEEAGVINSLSETHQQKPGRNKHESKKYGAKQYR